MANQINYEPDLGTFQPTGADTVFQGVDDTDIGNLPGGMDDLDDFSYLSNMDLSTADSGGEATETAMDDIWDIMSTPQPEMLTPDTSVMDETPTKSDEKNESRDEDTYSEPLKYHLRPQTRELKSSFTRTWIDRDESGNYGERDPNDEIRKAKRRANRVEFRLRSDDLKSDEIDGDGANNDRRTKGIPKLEVTLTFQSESSEAKFEHLISAATARAKLQEHEESSNGYRLRRRGSAPSTRYYSEANLDKSQFDPGLSDGLKGHPSARGCWECLLLGLRCPLLDDERAWPCMTCVDDNHDCELVTPPEFKRACQRCRRGKASCSYLYTHQHGEACQQCMNDGFRCVAGPAKDTVPTRIRYDRDWENDPLQKQKPFKARKMPKQNEPVDMPVVDELTANLTAYQGDEGVADMGVLDDDEGYSSSHRASNVHKRKLNSVGRPDRPNKKARRTDDGSKGKTRTIETKFCHPIIFNHHDADDGTSCHFCSDPSYSIFGLEAKEVEVIDWNDGRGLEEMSGGHKGEGVESTRVCLKCTTERIPIIMCRSHEGRPIQGVRNNALDLNDAFAEVLSGSGKLKGRWCAICANLARYECCTPSEEGDGCGLLTCEQCMVELSGIYDGDLQKMLPCVSKQPSEERVFGLRADCEFLKEDGLLMRYVLWNSQPS